MLRSLGHSLKIWKRGSLNFIIPMSQKASGRLTAEIDDILGMIDNILATQPAMKQQKRSFATTNGPYTIELPTMAGSKKKPAVEPRTHGTKRSLDSMSTQIVGQSSKKQRTASNPFFDLQAEATSVLTNLLMSATKQVFGDDKCTLDRQVLYDKIHKPKKGQGHLCFPVFGLKDMIEVDGKFNPMQIASAIVGHLAASCPNEFIAEISQAGPYLNFTLNTRFLGQIVSKILDENNSFVDAIPRLESEKEQVMIEYSQPNTHKAFHVGHMRNCAIGDCLVRLWEHYGHSVRAVNYFGDEGKHVAKCVWLLKRMMDDGFTLEDAPKTGRGEWLGEMYSRATFMSDLRTFTEFALDPREDGPVVVGQVLSKEPHPSEPSFNICEVDYGEGKSIVVCGGTDYNVGDKVGYIPVGGKYKKKDVVVKAKKGVGSEGVIMGALELGVDLGPMPMPAVAPTQPAVETTPSPVQEEKGGKKKKKKKK